MNIDEGLLLMPFKDEIRSFSNGFEIGQMWEKMNNNYKFKNYIFHSENTNQVEMMCKRFYFNFEINIIDENWSTLTAEISAQAN